MPKIDLGTVTTSNEDARGKRWVEIPTKDLFDFPFPAVRINTTAYEPGNRYFVEAAVADWIENRIQAKQDADLRVMRPTQDVTSQNAMNRFGVGAGRGNYVKNPDAVLG